MRDSERLPRVRQARALRRGQPPQARRRRPGHDRAAAGHGAPPIVRGPSGPAPPEAASGGGRADDFGPAPPPGPRSGCRRPPRRRRTRLRLQRAAPTRAQPWKTCCMRPALCCGTRRGSTVASSPSGPDEPASPPARGRPRRRLPRARGSSVAAACVDLRTTTPAAADAGQLSLPRAVASGNRMEANACRAPPGVLRSTSASP